MTRLKTQNFLTWIVTDAIITTWDFSATISPTPSYTKGFIVIDSTNAWTREELYFHNRVGNTIFVAEINRPNPKFHSAGATYQMTNSAELINYLSDNTNTFWYVEKIWGLNIVVWGWYVKTLTWRQLIADTQITLPAQETNYIYLSSTNVIAATLDLSIAEAWTILATVISWATKVANISQEQPFGGWIGWTVDTSNLVHITWAETITWVKTFSVSPIVPTPIADMEVATKKYVDDNAGWGGGWSWTVTSVWSSNSDIFVITPTTTPILTLNSWTWPNQIVKLDSNWKLPAIDGSQLTNLPSSGGGWSWTVLYDRQIASWATVFTLPFSYTIWNHWLYVFINWLLQSVLYDYIETTTTTITFTGLSTAPIVWDEVVFIYSTWWSSSSSSTEIYNETPSWAVNWLNQIFTLSNSCVSWSTRLFLNWIRQKLGNDYTQSSPTTVAFISPPFTGDEIIIDYTLFI